MNRLQAELRRLYLSHNVGRQTADSEELGLVGGSGRVKALVLELARPASWNVLAPVWQGVQVDLELPAPAIAVSGIDGYQLWFSLSEPVPVAQASAFLESLRCRYLGDVAPERIGHVSVVPPVQTAPGRWSAFVAPDLAALFADEPWLDLQPGADAQADVLARLKSTTPADWNRALERLRPFDARGSAPVPPALADTPDPEAGKPDQQSAPTAHGLDPRRFLLEIMNNGAVELHLRIEAAKALLPYFEGQRRP